jgi:hypothetical protein
VADAAPLEYAARGARWAREQEALTRRDRRIAATRLAVFGLFVLAGVLAFRGVLSGWWLLLPVVAFARLLQQHDRVIRARDSAARLVAFYERGVARLEDRWIGTGDTGERFLSDNHLYAADLDLFGRGSLFELLSLARTRSGEETLASWLKHSAPAASIRERHGAILELREALDLRESLTLAGTDIRTAVLPDELQAWGAAPLEGAEPGGRATVVVLTIVLPLLVLVAWQTGSLTYLIVAGVLRVAYQHFAGESLEQRLRRADMAARGLDVLRPALRLLEERSFESALLRSLQAELRESRTPSASARPAPDKASAAIRTLCRYVEMHDWTRNVVFMPIAAILMWDSHLARAIERWRATHGVHIAAWLRVVGEFEALSSLAAYSYEHPQDPLPVVHGDEAAPGATPALFDGRSLGHPLLPGAQMVRNDVRLDADARLIVVSGSNMSGKSTLLRTVGINAVLALAGAPVRATSLELSSLAIGATLRIQDSLQQGRSRFFAEITRIRQIADLAAAQPTLFLLDELFHGTNSHDRLLGATGVLRTLLDRGAIGLITTHDLALTAITRDLGARAVNAHFEDSFDGEGIRFDYRMKPGPVTRSNAIALMRAVGLEIQENQ